MIHFSNDLCCLAEGLSQTVFKEKNHTESNPFDQKIVIVPSDRYKRILQEYFATHPQFSVAMGLKIQILPDYLLSLRQDTKIPSFSLLQMRIFAQARKYHQEISTLQIKTICKDLAHLFQRYGFCEEKHLEKWLEKGGWQQLLWKEIYEEGAWSYPSKICENIQHVEKVPFLFGFSSLPKPIALFFKRIQAPMFFFSPCRVFWADLDGHEKRSPLGLWGKWGVRFLNACSTEEMTTEEDYQEPEDLGMLGILQKSILDLEFLQVPCEMDSTIRIFSAKSRRQEVEELFESLARILQKHEGLKPSDILVLAPELSLYVPHIHAVFQRGKTMFDYRISGLDRKSVSSLAQGILLLFGVVEEKWDLQAIIALFSNASFASKHKWGKADLELIEKWLSMAKMTWGLSKLDFSIERLILGLCSIDPRNAPKPCSVISWPESELFDSLILIVEELRSDLKVENERPLGEWLSMLLVWRDRYFEDKEETWFEKEVKRLEETSLGCDEPIYSWQDIKGICEDLFAKRTESYQRHLLEAVHFDALEEGHVFSKKVIAVLGMQEGAFPRIERETALDQMEPKLPSKGEIDRFLFLEVLLKAKKQIILSFLHSCPLKGIGLSPSLVIEELCNYLNGLKVEKLPEVSFFTGDIYFSDSSYLQAKAYGRREKAKNYFAKEWQEFIPLPDISIEDSEIEIADLKMLFKDPLEFFFRKSLGFSLKYRDESAFYEGDFFLKKYERQNLIEKSLKSDLYLSAEAILKNQEKEKGLPFGIFEEITEMKLQNDIEEVKSNCLRNNIAAEEIRDIEIPPWKIQWNEKTSITLKGTIENVLKTRGLVELFKEPVSRISLWKRWPEILILRGHPDLQQLPHQMVLAYAKKNAIRDFSHLDKEKEIRKLIYYYFMSLHRPSPLYPKWAEAILEANPEKLLNKIKEAQTRYAHWVIQRDGLPNSIVLCGTWEELAKTTFSSLDLLRN